MRAVFVSGVEKLFHWIPALDNSNQEQNDCDYEKNIDEAANGVRCDEAKKPEDNEDDCDGYEHIVVDR